MEQLKSFADESLAVFIFLPIILDAAKSFFSSMNTTNNEWQCAREKKTYT